MPDWWQVEARRTKKFARQKPHEKAAPDGAHANRCKAEIKGAMFFELAATCPCNQVSSQHKVRYRFEDLTNFEDPTRYFDGIGEAEGRCPLFWTLFGENVQHEYTGHGLYIIQATFRGESITLLSPVMTSVRPRFSTRLRFLERPARSGWDVRNGRSIEMRTPFLVQTTFQIRLRPPARQPNEHSVIWRGLPSKSFRYGEYRVSPTFSAGMNHS